MKREFEIKELKNLKYFLGIEVARSKKEIFISQQKCFTDLLRDTVKLACKSINSPIDQNHKLGEVEGDIAMDREVYQKLVG